MPNDRSSSSPALGSLQGSKSVTNLRMRSSREIAQLVAASSKRPRPDIDSRFRKPETMQESLLVEIWQDVLRMEGIGAEDNFFELGGDSLQMAQIAGRIRSAFGYELTWATFFQSPSIAALAVLLPEPITLAVSLEPQVLDRLAAAEVKSVSDVAEYRTADLDLLDAGSGWTFAFHPRAGTLTKIDSRLAKLVQSCSTFRKLAEHIESAADKEREGLLNSLESAISQGLLSTPADDLTFLHENGTQEPPAKIDCLVVVTAGRPEALQRALESYGKNLSESKRRLQILVVEDGFPDASSGENASVTNQHGPVRHIGFGEKRRLVEVLVSQGIPREVTSFALWDPLGCRCGTSGANRNAVLLFTHGKAIVTVDDDTECILRGPSGARAGLALVDGRLSAHCVPSDHWFFPDRAELLRDTFVQQSDFIAGHEEFLGGAAASVAYRLRANIHQTTPSFVRQISQSKIRVTLNGVAGDCGWGSPLPYLMMDGPSLERLVSSEEDYRKTVASREVLRVSNGPIIFDRASNVMSTAWGLDNRELLPPFMPVGRGSDRVFALTLKACSPHACFAQLPQAILHSPREERRFWTGELLRSASATDIATIIGVLVESYIPGGDAETSEQMRRLGRYLKGMAGGSREHFQSALRYELARNYSATIHQLAAKLDRYSGKCLTWEGDVRAYIATLQNSVAKEDTIIPADLVYSHGIERAAELSREIVSHFGDLLISWPDLVAAAGAFA